MKMGFFKSILAPGEESLKSCIIMRVCMDAYFCDLAWHAIRECSMLPPVLKRFSGAALENCISCPSTHTLPYMGLA